jgi:hypothetical protein
LQLDAPVRGKILMSGGNITLNSSVGGDVIGGNVSHLTLEPQAKINGNLSYKSEEPAKQDTGSSVIGKTNFHKIEKNREKPQIVQAFAGASFYKLIVDIILSLLLIYFFRNSILSVLNRMRTAPLKSTGIGFVYVLLAPIASVILLILIWLGIASFIFYFLVLLISVFIVKLFLGWSVLHWWSNRQKQAYQLDWKTGIVGPILLFILLIIPVLGWLVAAIIFFAATGALLGILLDQMPRLQRINKK